MDPRSSHRMLVSERPHFESLNYSVKMLIINLLLTLFVERIEAVRLVTSHSGNRLSQSFAHSSSDARFLKDEEPVQYHLWDSREIKETLDHWKTEYPDFIRVTTSQEAYDLPRAGKDEDCPFDEGQGCPNYMFTIQDFIVHPDGSDSSTHLPEVLWSGCLHGNERVGPTSVMEAASLLLEAAVCESKPKFHNGHSGHDSELAEAKACRHKLKEKGVDHLQRQWLARLVTTRRIVVVPTANALGYYRNKREEEGIDPNRDFPYDVASPRMCMQTIAGRTLNEIFQEHMFQLSLTFHAGMEVVGYEWGAPTWKNGLSPDDIAQSEIAAAYSRYGGGWSHSKPYEYGTMNDLVYPVNGGMEDWAYAGSWDPDRVIQCDPRTHGGYPKERTVYDNSTLRVFNMLVETSDDKTPRNDDLGTSLDVLSRDTEGNGHVSRNIRLALLAADLVEPYVSFVGVADLALSDDVVPSMERGGLSCQESKAVIIPSSTTQIEVEWTVGGAITVDQTELWYAKWDDIPEGQLDCLQQPDSLDGFTRGGPLGAINGTGFFSRAGPFPRPDANTKTENTPALGPLFRGSIDIPEGLKPLDRIVVLASARVDKSWSDSPSNGTPDLRPQSHIVNARTDPDWHHHSGDKHVRGRLDWYSVPLTIVIGDFKASVGFQGDKKINVIEAHSRFGDSTGMNKGGMKPGSGEGGKGGMIPGSGEGDDWTLLMWEAIAIVMSLCVCAMLCCYCCGCGRRRKSKRRRNGHPLSSDSFEFDSKPYSDAADDDEEYSDDDSYEDEYGDEDDEDDDIELPPLGK